MNANLYYLFQSRFANQLDQTCLVLPDNTQWTYGEIDKLSAQFAVVLRNAGVNPGDRVTVQVEKSAANVALYLACLRSGAVFVPLNTAYTAKEVEFFLSDAEPRVFVCRPEDEAVLTPIAESAGVSKIYSLDDSSESTLWRELDRGASDDTIIERTPDDLAAILYTSGTTGRSKGAMLTHHNLSSNVLSLHQLWGFQPGDVLLHALPIFHVHGLFVALHCALLNASKMLFLPRFDLAQVMDSLNEATVMMGVPTFYTRLLDTPDFGTASCNNIRLFVSGSAPLTEATFQAFESRTGHRILERYGMTESGMITSNPLDGERLAGTVGYPLPDVEVRVTGEGGAPLPTGEIGAVEVRGPNIFKGYWKLPEKTAQEFRDDGFFITGDLGSLSEDGRLTLVGREKDLIISGGYNVYPKEIEACLDALPGIIESAVIGLPHSDFGEAVAAVLVTEPGNTPDIEVINAALAEQLARFKHPKQVFFIKELPRNAMGKVQKNQLREQYKKTFQ